VPKPEFVFNRRWFVRPESNPPNPFGVSGEQVRMNPPAGSADLIRPAGPVDPEFSVLSVRHADGNALALLANYGLHYVGGTRRGDISADYFGAFAKAVEELTGNGDGGAPFIAMMSNGTSGDVNAINFREARQQQEPYARMREAARDLAETAARLAAQATYHSQPSLAAACHDLTLEVRKPDARRLAWARETWAGVREGERLTRPQVYARETLALQEFPPTVKVPLQALRIGSLGIAAVPCEVFAETGLAIKERSALQPTFTIELANGYFGYLPTPEQHQWGGYETWAARSSCLETQAEPKIRAEALRLLSAVSDKQV
jgi:hypothetical protein